jgi:hypothetical protein
VEGTKDSPIALGSDEEDARAGQKRKRYTTVMENGKKRRVVNLVRAETPTEVSYMLAKCCWQHDFHPELQEAIEELKGAITKGWPLAYSLYVFFSILIELSRELG